MRCFLLLELIECSDGFALRMAYRAGGISRGSYKGDQDARRAGRPAEGDRTLTEAPGVR